jgi:hypothetical protein
LRRYVGQRRRLQWAEAAEREEGHKSDTLHRQGVEECVVVAADEFVLILDADDVGNLTCLRELRGRPLQYEGAR